MMDILVIGCGILGSNIAADLERLGNTVSVLDKEYDRFKLLPETFNGKRDVGDALVKEVLIRAHADQVDAVVLTMGKDVLNLTLARLLQERFQIKNIIALNSDPMMRGYYNDLHVHTISTMGWGVLRVEEILSGIANEEENGHSETGVMAYNVLIPDGTKNITGSELAAIEDCFVFSVTQHNLTTRVTPDMAINSGDVLHISASANGLRKLYEVLGIEKKEEHK